MVSMEKFSEPGQTYREFLITRRLDIPELQCTLTELTHEPTGAQVIHISNDDQENVFCLSLRTLPEKSTGVAHILEHTVLCGSEKFPVKDPFFGMSRRSLNTYMNALTGADFTCYPAASQVPKDFYNLLEVYLDAVFRPHLKMHSFLQEGYRIELSNPEDPNSPLDYKGIVFNEMKGAMASPDARLSHAVMEQLFPHLTYGINSGGDPKVIPELTYDELKAFHEKYYHPSQCLFFFYGNLPLNGHLDFLLEHGLKGVQKAEKLPIMDKQPRFSQPIYRTLTYPITAEEDAANKTMVAFAWLTCSILEQEELLALNIIDLVLMGTDAAPLKLALLQSGLCKQTDSVIDNEISEVPFAIICKGCTPDSADALQHVIKNELEKIIKNGLPEHLVQGSIHQIEFYRSEITGDSSPFGLSLFLRSGLLKQHGGNPEDGLMIHTLFKKLREKVENPRYLPDLIQKHLLDNQHFVRIVMHPDPTLAAKELAEEKEVLERLKKELSQEAVDKIVHQAKQLIAYQEAEEEQDIDILPKIALSDVSRQAEDFILYKERQGNLELFHHPCFTNGIVYADLFFNLPKILQSELPYVRLFAMLLSQMGCGGRNYKQNLDYLLEHTGGVGASLELFLQAADPTLMNPTLSIRGKALHRKVDKLFPLLYDMVQSVDFTDRARIKELLDQHYLNLENSLNHSALRYAVNLAASGLSQPGNIQNQWYGLDYFWQIKQLVQEFDQKSSDLIEILKELQKRCLHASNADLVLSCDQKTYHELAARQFYGLCDIPTYDFKTWENDFPIRKISNQGRLISSPVSFTASLFSTVPYTHPSSAALAACAQIMDNNVLHKRIREQGGAYGGGATSGSMSGQFYFYSYRDPHIVSSLNAFEESVQFLADGEFDHVDVEEAKLGILQDLDSPCSPGSRALVAYSRLRSGRNLTRRQEFRHQLLDLTEEHIQETAETYLIPGMENAVTITFGGKDLLEKENQLLIDADKPSLQIYPI